MLTKFQEDTESMYTITPSQNGNMANTDHHIVIHKRSSDHAMFWSLLITHSYIIIHNTQILTSNVTNINHLPYTTYAFLPHCGQTVIS